MWRALEQWSMTTLGQWHYVLGYSITLVSHNWPIMLALGLSLVFAVRAYRRPDRARVCWLLSAVLLGLAYEYQKHVAGVLHEAIDFLFGRELAGLNRPLHLLVGPAMQAALVLSLAAVVAQAVRLTWFEQRDDQTGHTPTISDQQRAEGPTG